MKGSAIWLRRALAWGDLDMVLQFQFWKIMDGFTHRGVFCLETYWDLTVSFSFDLCRPWANNGSDEAMYSPNPGELGTLKLV